MSPRSDSAAVSRVASVPTIKKVAIPPCGEFDLTAHPQPDELVVVLAVDPPVDSVPMAPPMPGLRLLRPPFPAHAGMNHSDQIIRFLRRPVPRARGYEPRGGAAHSPSISQRRSSGTTASAWAGRKGRSLLIGGRAQRARP